MVVTYKGTQIKVETGTKVYDIVKQDIEDSPILVMACKCNNQVRSLEYEIEEDTQLELLTYENVDGKSVYIRGIMYIMSKAFNELYPELLITVDYQLSNAMFCEIDNKTVTLEMIEKVKEKMQEIIDKNIKIRKIVMTKEQAEEFYAKEKTLKGRLQIDRKETVSLYYCEDYYNYFYGVMPISTGFMKIFDIVKYNKGFLVRYPSSKRPDKLQTFVDNKKLLSTLQEYEDIHRILNINTVYKLNNQTKLDKAKQAILLDEALHEKKIAEIANEIVKNRNVKMVLIAGPSSSGKTTFAKRLGIQLKLNGLKPVTLSVDNYFVERENNPKDEHGNYDFECIEAIDLDLFNNHLTKLLKGEKVEMPEFDFKIGTKKYNGKNMQLTKGEILVIEGIHCLNDKLTQAIAKEEKYKIYISALTVLNLDYYNRISTTDTRLIRRIIRDYKYRGYSAEHTIKMWYSVNRGEEKNIFPFQEEADSMFNSSLIYELGVLKEQALPLLKEIDKTKSEYSEAQRLINFLEYFESIPEKDIPKTSLLREFIGGSTFEEQ